MADIERRLRRAEVRIGLSPALTGQHLKMLRELYMIKSRMDGTPMPDADTLQVEAERLAATRMSPAACWLEAMQATWEEAHR